MNMLASSASSRERDVRDEEQVEERGRQRHDHHHDDADDRGGDRDLSDAVGFHGAPERLVLRAVRGRFVHDPDRRSAPGVDAFRPIAEIAVRGATGLGSSW